MIFCGESVESVASVFCHSTLNIARHSNVEDMRTTGDDIGVVATALHSLELKERARACLDAEGNVALDMNGRPFSQSG